MVWGLSWRFSNLSRFVTEIFHQFQLNQLGVTEVFPNISDNFDFLNFPQSGLLPRIQRLILVDDLFVMDLDIQSFIWPPR